MQSLLLAALLIGAPPLHTQDVKFTQPTVTAPLPDAPDGTETAQPVERITNEHRAQPAATPRISGVQASAPLASTPAPTLPQPYASIPMAPQGPYTTQYAAASYSTGNTPCAPCGSQATTYQATTYSYNGSTPCGQPVAAAPCAPCGQQAAAPCDPCGQQTATYQTTTYQSYGYQRAGYQRAGFRPFRGWFRRG